MIRHTVLAALIIAGTACSKPVDSDSDPHTDEPSDGFPWPRNPAKEELVDPDPLRTYPQVGSDVPRLITVDQFENEVDLYDFYQADRPILVQLVYPDEREASNDLGKLLAGIDGPLSDGPLSRLPDAVQDGDLWFVRVLVASRFGAGVDATYDDVEYWNGLYPQDGSPLLLDDQALIYLYTTRFWQHHEPREIPEVFRIDPATFTVSADPQGSLDNIADVLAETD